ncbi:hypothetical protein EAT1b_0841 [Exiguobacterium sp. AT1b]|uniref:DUF3784 domain-containing protein n=1 Tax=Exiguobacterium sp. (strain ATCC BAA-1283 / AT1b) TaxID=360911 RepID=C4L5F5_EXISA|nr:hypothetical protein [Exiguobacterium sp. AT1b]ACQ69770.1 hypothetical protein EAT1b_0841 [Exiguobacterium sp. AT1b]
MDQVLLYGILVLIVGVIVSELYKANFERKIESQDERGRQIALKVKSISYSMLSIGVYVGVALVAIFQVFDQYNFIYFVMLVFFIQSIGSSIYLAVIRRT